MNVAVQPRQSLRFRGRSFMALVLAPEPPLGLWMTELDSWAKRSPGFFVGRPIILDVSALPHEKDGLVALLADLAARDVRPMGIEGTKPSWVGAGMPPLVGGGKSGAAMEIPEIPPATPAAAKGAKKGSATLIPPPPQPSKSLVHGSPVRSGQSIIHPEGDVTIIGSVASGSEIIAGGSIHIYGALRGRAIAGSMGNPKARIFCGKLEAELLAIDGLYRTADEMEQQYRGKPVQTWLDGDAMIMAALN